MRCLAEYCCTLMVRSAGVLSSLCCSARKFRVARLTAAQERLKAIRRLSGSQPRSEPAQKESVRTQLKPVGASAMNLLSNRRRNVLTRSVDEARDLRTEGERLSARRKSARNSNSAATVKPAVPRLPAAGSRQFDRCNARVLSNWQFRLKRGAGEPERRWVIHARRL